MSTEEPDKNPPELVPAEPGSQLDALVEDERASVQIDTSITKGEAAQFDKGQGLDKARAYQDFKEQKRESAEKSGTFELRQSYVPRLFMLTCLWLVFVLLFVFLTGFRGHSGFLLPYTRISLNLTDAECPGCWHFQFALSDRVLIAFITSTTASVIGIFYVVAKWLFPAPPQDKPTEPKT